MTMAHHTTPIAVLPLLRNDWSGMQTKDYGVAATVIIRVSLCMYSICMDRSFHFGFNNQAVRSLIKK